MKPGKKEAKAIAKVMDQEYESLEEAAEAVIAEAWRLYESVACWTVVGQLQYAPGGGYASKDEAQASKIALGHYRTENQADTAALSMTHSSATGEDFLTWTLPVFHGSPHEFYTNRKYEKNRIAYKADESAVAARERALKRRIDFFALHGHSEFPPDIDDETDRCVRCGQTLPEHEQNTIRLP